MDPNSEWKRPLAQSNKSLSSFSTVTSTSTKEALSLSFVYLPNPTQIGGYPLFSPAGLWRIWCTSLRVIAAIFKMAVIKYTPSTRRNFADRQKTQYITHKHFSPFCNCVCVQEGRMGKKDGWREEGGWEGVALEFEWHRFQRLSHCRENLRGCCKWNRYVIITRAPCLGPCFHRHATIMRQFVQTWHQRFEPQHLLGNCCGCWTVDVAVGEQMLLLGSRCCCWGVDVAVGQ